jgi:hypothetical protein
MGCSLGLLDFSFRNTTGFIFVSYFLNHILKIILLCFMVKTFRAQIIILKILIIALVFIFKQRSFRNFVRIRFIFKAFL